MRKSQRFVFLSPICSTLAPHDYDASDNTGNRGPSIQPPAGPSMGNLSVEDSVMLYGLKAKLELNGATGTVKAFLVAAGLYLVQLDDGQVHGSIHIGLWKNIEDYTECFECR